MTDLQRLERLLRAAHPCIVIQTHEEDDALTLVREAALHAGRNIRTWSVVTGVRDGMLSGTQPLAETDHPAAALFRLAQFNEPAVNIMLDLVAHLSDARTLRLLRDLIDRCARTGSALVLIDHADSLPPVLQAVATPFEPSLPDEAELEQLIRKVVGLERQSRPVHVEITKPVLRTIVRNLRGLTRRQAERIIYDCIAEDRRFDANDVNTVLAGKRRALGASGLLEYIEAPVSLAEIGGLKRLKAWLKAREHALSDEAAAFGLPAPRGVLMLGVQGAGKSMCAKAIAAAWQRPLLRLDVGALYDKYIGESERRLRDALRQAEMMAPIVLWIDEIEKAFASAASRSTDGGLSQRMFGTLLTWMQEHTHPVFLVATANDIEALPPELLRKGRFDEIFFVDLPGKTARRQILEIHLKKRGRDPAGFDLDTLVAASEGYSGAEIEQAIIAAMHDAFAAKSELSTGLLTSALRASPPLSVTMAERVAALRAWAKGRCVGAE